MIILSSLFLSFWNNRLNYISPPFIWGHCPLIAIDLNCNIKDWLGWIKTLTANLSGHLQKRFLETSVTKSYSPIKTAYDTIVKSKSFLWSVILGKCPQPLNIMLHGKVQTYSCQTISISTTESHSGRISFVTHLWHKWTPRGNSGHYIRDIQAFDKFDHSASLNKIP